MSHTQRLIDMLTLQELLELKQQVEAEIRRRNSSQPHDHACPARFSPGDQVTFAHETITYFATVIRINPKTVTVAAQSPRTGTWRVSPSFLTHIRSATA